MVIRKLQMAATMAAIAILTYTGGVYALHTYATPPHRTIQAAPMMPIAARPSEPASVYTLRVDPAASSPGTPDMTMTVSQQSSAERWDMTIPQSGATQTKTMLMPQDSHSAFGLIPGTKGYFSVPLSLLPDPFVFQIFLEDFIDGPSSGNNKMTFTYQIRDLGPVLVDGTRTEHYAVTQRLQMQNTALNDDTTLNIGLWLAPGQGAETAEAQRLLPVQTAIESNGKTLTRIIQGNTKALATLAELLPVKITMAADGKTVTFKLASHSTQPLAASVFQIPEGYQEIGTQNRAPASVPVRPGP